MCIKSKRADTPAGRARACTHASTQTKQRVLLSLQRRHLEQYLATGAVVSCVYKKSTSISTSRCVTRAAASRNSSVRAKRSQK